MTNALKSPEQSPLKPGAFTLVAPDGRVFRIWADGSHEGFPEGCIVLNGLIQHINERIAAARAA